MKTLLAGFLAAGLVAATVHAQSSTWKVPRTPDGHPDLQGVWSNNSVTPMTRPAQWKDKERLTDAEVEELKQLVAQYTDQGGDAIFGSLVQMALTAKEKGEFNQTSYDRTDRELQPVLDGGSRLGQPDLAHYGPEERSDAAGDG